VLVPCTAALVAAVSPSSAAPTAPSLLLDDVEIHRDTDTGVPHILGDSDQAAYYGLGYVCASDRLFQMHLLRQSAKGELTELIGYRVKPSTQEKIDVCGDQLDPFDDSTVASDRFYRMIGLYEKAEDLILDGHIDDYTLSALEAYCAGVNDYIESRQDGAEWDTVPHHPHFGGNRPSDWLPQDCLAVWNYLGSFSFQGDWKSAEVELYKDFQAQLDMMKTVDEAVNFALGIPVGAPLPSPIWDDAGFMVEFSDYGDVGAGSTYPQGDLEDDIVAFYNANLPYKGQALTDLGTSCVTVPRPGFSARKSSHSWALSGDRTVSGAAIVHGDSRNFIGAPSLFYEYRIRGLGFDARGAGFPGTPGLFAFGFNENVAWSGSGAGLDMRDSIVLQGVSGNQFDWDGGAGTIVTDSQTIDYDSDGDGSLDAQESFDVRRAYDAGGEDGGEDLGPVVTDLVNNPGPYEFVLRTPDQFFDRHTLQSSLRMMHAYDARDFRQQVKGWITPNVYMVFGDVAGTIGATYAASVPARAAGAPLAGMMAQPVDDPSEDWQGWIPYDLVPWSIKDTGLFITANQAGAGCWYPNYLNPQSRGDNDRSLRLAEVLDPDGTSVFTRQQITDTVAQDETVPAPRELVRWAIEVRDAGYTGLWNPPPNSPMDMQPAKNLVDVLEGWLNGTDTTGVCGDSGTGPYISVDEPYARGAAALAAPRIQKVGQGFDPVELAATYGIGSEGANRLVEALSLRTTPLDPANSALDAEIIDWLAIRFFYAANAATCTDVCHNPTGPNASCPSNSYIGPCAWESEYAATAGTKEVLNMLTFAGFGSLQDLAGPETLDVTTPIDNGEKTSVFSLSGRSFAQTVDLANPADAHAIQPIGNQESPSAGSYYSSNVMEYSVGDLLPAPLQPGLDGSPPANYQLEVSFSRAVAVGHYGVGTPHTTEDPTMPMVEGPIHPRITGGVQQEGDTAYTLTLTDAPANVCVILYAGDAPLSSSSATLLRGARLWNNHKHTRDWGWSFTGQTDSNGELTMTLHDFEHPQTGESLIDFLQAGDEVFYQFLIHSEELPVGETCGNHTSTPDLVATNGLRVVIQ